MENDSEKVSFEEIKARYENTLDHVLKNLFESQFKDHGWTLEEFANAMLSEVNRPIVQPLTYH